MRTNNCQNQENNQLPNQVAADQAKPTINVADVNYAIKQLINYDEPYSKGIVVVFQKYLVHQDFVKMKDELETVPAANGPSWREWDINTNIGFLEVIYPSDTKGGATC